MSAITIYIILQEGGSGRQMSAKWGNWLAVGGGTRTRDIHVQTLRP